MYKILTQFALCDLPAPRPSHSHVIIMGTFALGFPRDGTSRDNPGWAIQLSLCPGTKIFPCPNVPLSRDKDRSINPGTESIPNWEKIVKKLSKKGIFFHRLHVLKQAGKGRSKTEKDVLKQEKKVLKQDIWSFFLKMSKF